MFMLMSHFVPSVWPSVMFSLYCIHSFPFKLPLFYVSSHLVLSSLPLIMSRSKGLEQVKLAVAGRSNGALLSLKHQDHNQDLTHISSFYSVSPLNHYSCLLLLKTDLKVREWATYICVEDTEKWRRKPDPCSQKIIIWYWRKKKQGINKEMLIYCFRVISLCFVPLQTRHCYTVPKVPVVGFKKEYKKPCSQAEVHLKLF